MNHLALLAALLLPTPSLADPSEGVLGYRWGQPAGDLTGERSSTRVDLATGAHTPPCHEVQPSESGLLAGALRSVELCYHDDALFLVELNLSATRVQLAEEVLREKYGEPTVTERERSEHRHRTERSRDHAERSRSHGERSERSHRQTLSWELKDVDIQLEGWRVRYLYRPTADSIERVALERQQDLREQLRTVL